MSEEDSCFTSYFAQELWDEMMATTVESKKMQIMHKMTAEQIWTRPDNWSTKEFSTASKIRSEKPNGNKFTSLLCTYTDFKLCYVYVCVDRAMCIRLFSMRYNLAEVPPS